MSTSYGPYLDGYVPVPASPAPANPAPSLADTFSNVFNKAADLGAQYLGAKLSADAAKAQAKAQVTSANAAAQAAAAGSSHASVPTAPAWLMPAALIAGVLGGVALLFGLTRR